MVRRPGACLRPPPSRLRKLAFAALASALGLGGVEATCALIERTALPLTRTLPVPAPGHEVWPQLQVPEAEQLALAEDATKRWGMAPGSTQTVAGLTHNINELGLRGPDFGPRAPGEARLFTLGDSSIYGVGVPEADLFSRVAARRLGTAWGCDVVDVNGGGPGYDTGQSLQRLRELIDVVDPQWVVIGNLWSDVYLVRGLARDDVVDVAALRSPLRRLATWRVLRTLLAPALATQRVRFLASTDDIADLDAGDTPRVRLGSYLANLRAMAGLVQARGAQVAFLLLPAPMDLDAAPVPETVLEYRAAMRQVAGEVGAPVVDGPAWLEAEGGGLGLFADQVHPNALGHALLGHALAETLGGLDAPAPCRSGG